MDIDILTLFPDMFAPLDMSILGRAQERGLLNVRLWNIRDFTDDRHRTVDDTPYGGGPGMVLKPEPIYRAFEAANIHSEKKADHVILLTPVGEKLTHRKVKQLAEADRIMLICGHYEGFDERIRKLIATDEVSIGDYVLTGGELPAMVIVDAVARHVPGVLGSEAGADEDTFATGLLEYPQYTRPATFMGMDVPEVLRSGDHQAIERWRRRESLRRTFERRPELLKEVVLTEDDRAFLKQIVEG